MKNFRVNQVPGVKMLLNSPDDPNEPWFRSSDWKGAIAALPNDHGSLNEKIRSLPGTLFSDRLDGPSIAQKKHFAMTKKMATAQPGEFSTPQAPGAVANGRNPFADVAPLPSSGTGDLKWNQQTHQWEGEGRDVTAPARRLMRNAAPPSAADAWGATAFGGDVARAPNDSDQLKNGIVQYSGGLFSDGDLVALDLAELRALHASVAPRTVTASSGGTSSEPGDSSIGQPGHGLAKGAVTNQVVRSATELLSPFDGKDANLHRQAFKSATSDFDLSKTPSGSQIGGALVSDGKGGSKPVDSIFRGGFPGQLAPGAITNENLAAGGPMSQAEIRRATYGK